MRRPILICHVISTGNGEHEYYEYCIDAPPVDQYVTAFYNAVLLIHGETVEPRLDSEKVFASVAILLGFCIIAIIFGDVTLLVGRFYADGERYDAKQTALYKEMAHLDLPLALRERITSYYDEIWRRYLPLARRPHRR